MLYFFDLEETLIESWTNRTLVNFRYIQSFIKDHNVKDVHLFSFAVWNDEDKDYFNKRIKQELEDIYNIKFVSVPSVLDMIEVDTEYTGIRYDSMTDFILIAGKVGAFKSWVYSKHPNQSAILLDDIVPNLDILNRDTNVLLRYIKV